MTPGPGEPTEPTELRVTDVMDEPADVGPPETSTSTPQLEATTEELSRQLVEIRTRRERARIEEEIQIEKARFEQEQESRQRELASIRAPSITPQQSMAPPIMPYGAKRPSSIHSNHSTSSNYSEGNAHDNHGGLPRGTPATVLRKDSTWSDFQYFLNAQLFYFRINSKYFVRDEDKINSLVSKLDKEMLGSFLQDMEAQPLIQTDLDAFKVWIHNYLENPLYTKEVTILEWFSLCQGKEERAREFSKRLLNVSNRYPRPQGDEEKKERFLTGLTEDLRNEFRKNRDIKEDIDFTKYAQEVDSTELRLKSRTHLHANLNQLDVRGNDSKPLGDTKDNSKPQNPRGKKRGRAQDRSENHETKRGKPNQAKTCDRCGRTHETAVCFANKHIDGHELTSPPNAPPPADWSKTNSKN